MQKRPSFTVQNRPCSLRNSGMSVAHLTSMKANNHDDEVIRAEGEGMLRTEAPAMIEAHVPIMNIAKARAGAAVRRIKQVKLPIWRHRAEAAITQQPFLALGLALGAGIVLGALFFARRPLDASNGIDKVAALRTGSPWGQRSGL
jgi:ElaB/YqjD/DUF883 family membrane-anchored ribosome-binding protein